MHCGVLSYSWGPFGYTEVGPGYFGQKLRVRVKGEHFWYVHALLPFGIPFGATCGFFGVILGVTFGPFGNTVGVTGSS